MKLLKLKQSLFFVLLISCTAIYSCTSQSQENGDANTISKVLSVADFEKGITATADIQLIDVRTPQEVAGGAIEGSLNYNFNGGDFNEKLKTLDPNKATYVYCKSGGRSGKTAKALKKLGFQEIYDLKGGFTAWKATH